VSPLIPGLKFQRTNPSRQHTIVTFLSQIVKPWWNHKRHAGLSTYKAFSVLKLIGNFRMLVKWRYDPMQKLSSIKNLRVFLAFTMKIHPALALSRQNMILTKAFVKKTGQVKCFADEILVLL